MAAQTLDGTRELTMMGDLAAQMVAGIDRYLLRAVAAAAAERAKLWHRDTTSPAAYAASVDGNRARFCRLIGAHEPRVAPDLQLVAPAAERRGTRAGGRPAVLGRLSGAARRPRRNFLETDPGAARMDNAPGNG